VLLDSLVLSKHRSHRWFTSAVSRVIRYLANVALSAMLISRVPTYRSVAEAGEQHCRHYSGVKVRVHGPWVFVTWNVVLPVPR
jgi:hypothetical protein